MSDTVYFDVQDVERETLDAMKKIAYMGYHRLALIRGMNQDDWTPAFQETAQRLYDMSQKIMSTSSAKLEAIETAQRFLEMYGSGKKKERGLQILAQMADKLKEGKLT